MKTILPIFIAITLVGTISSAFLMALAKNFHPEMDGVFHRVAVFSWKYCWPAGIAAAVIFLLVYHKAFNR